jgi:hypothetical protein
MRPILIGALVVILSSSAIGQWSKPASDYALESLGSSRVSKFAPEDSAGYLATLWGGGLRTFEHQHPVESLRRRIFVPRLFEKPISVVFQAFRIRTTQTFKVKAPLIVFVPGVFSDSGGITGQMTVKWFSGMGYHVLVVPNPLAADYISAKPKNPFPFPQNEADFVIEATERAIFEWVGSEWVTEVHLVGESLGAMVAAATLARDARLGKKLYTGGASFFWPPLSLSHSVDRIDELINRTQDAYEKECQSLTSDLIFQFRVLRGSILSNPTEQDQRCAPSIVGHFAFKQNLINVAQVLRMTRGQEALTLSEQMELRFHEFVRDYSFSEPMIETSSLVKLSHWLEEAQQLGVHNWRVLSSLDDFINAGRSWDDLKALDASGDRILLLPWGGHIGLSALNEFPRFLRQEFQRPPSPR